MAAVIRTIKDTATEDESVASNSADMDKTKSNEVLDEEVSLKSVIGAKDEPVGLVSEKN